MQHPSFGSATATPPSAAIAERLTVLPWWDPQLAVHGHDPRGAYAERFWLGVIGPSTLLLLRRLARGLEEFPAGFRVDTRETASSLGVGTGLGRHAPLNRSIDRACTFGLARRIDAETIEVRTHLPDLAARHLARLPESVQRSHQLWGAERPPEPTEPAPAA